MSFWGTAPSLAPGDDYVIIGQSDAVAGLGDGFAILGQAAQDHVGTALAAVGDLNGDGRADIMLTAPGSGKAYVVFGKSSNTTVSLATLAASGQGFVIRPTVASDLEGMTIAAGGDFNRDGIADYLIGVPKNDTGGIDLGAVYVVWGGSRIY